MFQAASTLTTLQRDTLGYSFKNPNFRRCYSKKENDSGENTTSDSDVKGSMNKSHTIESRTEPIPTDQNPKTNQNSIRQIWNFAETPFVHQDAKEWVSRYTSHLTPGKNWVREKFFNRFLKYVSWFDKRFENLSPETYKKYKILTTGMSSLISDIILVTEMATDLHYEADAHFHNYKRKELESYLELPKDIKKVVPLLLIFPLPGGALLCLPLASYFPRHFLSSHFWTPEQKQEFALLCHQRRVAYYRTLLRNLKRCAKKRLAAGEKRTNVISLVRKVEAGQIPTLEELKNIESYFQSQPFDLEYFSRSHKRALLKANNIQLVLLYQRNLYIEGRMLRAIDDVMVNEGLENLSEAEVSSLLFTRGLNPVGMTLEEQRSRLTNWVNITTQLDPKSIALYLHLPALIFYNERGTQREMEGKHVDLPND